MKKDLFRCRYWTGKFYTRQHESCGPECGFHGYCGECRSYYIPAKQYPCSSCQYCTIPTEEPTPGSSHFLQAGRKER